MFKLNELWKDREGNGALFKPSHALDWPSKFPPVDIPGNTEDNTLHYVTELE